MSEKKLKISAFLKKLYFILNEKSYSNIISWNELGSGFYIINHRKFCDEILEQFFKSNNFSSFIRQLNLYNFHKSKENGIEIFENKFFQKNNPKDLVNIHRQKTNERKKMCCSQNGICYCKLDLTSLILPTNELTEIRKIKYKTINACNTSIDTLKSIKNLEGKIEFLNYFYNDLSQKHNIFVKKLSKVNEIRNGLEKIFIYAIGQLCPSEEYNNFNSLTDEEKINKISEFVENLKKCNYFKLYEEGYLNKNKFHNCLMISKYVRDENLLPEYGNNYCNFFRNGKNITEDLSNELDLIEKIKQKQKDIFQNNFVNNHSLNNLINSEENNNYNLENFNNQKYCYNFNDNEKKWNFKTNENNDSKNYTKSTESENENNYYINKKRKYENEYKY